MSSIIVTAIEDEATPSAIMINSLFDTKSADGLAYSSSASVRETEPLVIS